MAARTSTVGVVGGGTMGVGIAYVFAAAGWHTMVVEPNSQRAYDMSFTWPPPPNRELSGESSVKRRHRPHRVRGTGGLHC